MKAEDLSKEAILDYSIKVDWFLQSLVDLVNKVKIEFPITLNVGGHLISGELISGQKYFEKLAEIASSGFKEEESRTRSSLFPGFHPRFSLWCHTICRSGNHCTVSILVGMVVLHEAGIPFCSFPQRAPCPSLLCANTLSHFHGLLYL